LQVHLADAIELDQRLEKNIVNDFEKARMTPGDLAVLEGIWSARAIVAQMHYEESERERLAMKKKLESQPRHRR
jgi:hypothetical protein